MIFTDVESATRKIAKGIKEEIPLVKQTGSFYLGLSLG